MSNHIYAKCPRCRSANPQARRFCETCGLRLVRDDADTPTLPPEFRREIDDSSPYLSPELASLETETTPPRHQGNRWVGWLVMATLLVMLLGAGGFLAATQWQQSAATAPQPTIVSSAVSAAVPDPEASNQTATPLANPAATSFAIYADLTATAQIGALANAETKTVNAAAATEYAATSRAQSIYQPTITVGRQPLTVDVTATAATRQTAIAGIDLTATALVPVVPSDTPILLGALPLYPGAQPVATDNAFARGVLDGLDLLRNERQSAEASVYTLPPGVTFAAVASYYDSELLPLGWSTPALSDIPAPGNGTQQGIAAWVRGNQRLILTYVAGGNITRSDDTGDDVTAPERGGYLVLTLVTSNI